jgi:hypothetical protein
LPLDLPENVLLETLDLGQNQLKIIPGAFIKSMTKLKTLRIDRNLIEYLPSEISDLDYLETLAIQLNRFPSIPSSIFTLKNLKQLSLEWFDYTDPVLPITFPPVTSPPGTMQAFFDLGKQSWQ